MAGLLGEAFGWQQNPWYQGFDRNRQAISRFGVGLMQGTGPQQGLEYAAEMMTEGAAEDRAERQRQDELRVQQDQKNATAAYLRQQGRDDLAQAIESGFMSGTDAFNTFYQESHAQPELTAEMRNWQYGQQNPGFMDYINPQGGAGTDDMQEYQYAVSQGYPGTYVDYQKEMKVKPGGPMDATTKKELFEAEDAVTAGQYVLSSLDRALELNKTALDGWAAGQRAQIGANIPDIGIGNANAQDYPTIEYQNVTTELALNQLKTIFGSMPTEGERKILLELQGSVDQPRAVREEILRRARAAAERRIADNQAKAEAIRNGAYFDSGYGTGQPTAPAGGYTILGVE